MSAASPFERPGLQAQLDDVTLNLYSFGQGRPVVFDAGLGCWSYTWSLVFSEIAQSARTILIDRAGYGFSSPSTAPRTAERIGEEMRAALRAINVEPPYTLVGHSFGGAISRWFARKYPHDVSALVLIDSGAYEYMKTSEMFDAYLERCRQAIDDGGASDLGLLSATAASRFPSTLVPLLERLNRSREVLSAIVSEGEHIHKETATQLRELPPMAEDVPLTLLSAGNRYGSLPPESRPPQAEMDEREREWLHFQKSLAETSIRSQLTIVDSGHFIQYERPDVVISAIQDILRVN